MSTQADLDAIAVKHIAKRLGESPDLAYEIGWGSEAFARIARAMAERWGIAEEEAMERLIPKGLPERARVLALKDRVERLEEILDEEVPGWRDDDAERGT